MAIYYTDQSRTYGSRVGFGGNHGVTVAVVNVAMTTAMLDNANDEVGLFWVPKGAVITGIVAKATDMDTVTGLVIDIGDDGDEDRLMAASTIGQAGTLSQTLAVAGHMFKYTVDTLIKAYINAAATSGVAGTLSVSLTYFVDPEFSSTALTATTTA